MSAKNKNVFEVGFLVLAGLVAFWVWRLVNLTVLPIFADEAIYLRWAQVMRAEPGLRFLPLSDGKQPLYMWLVMILLRLPLPPLVVGRLVSISAGFGSWLGVMFITWLVVKEKKAALFAGWLYAILPYFVFYDRLALADSLLAMLGIWFAALVLLLVRKPTLGGAFLAGLVLGFGLLTKSPAFFFALLWPVAILPNLQRSGRSICFGWLAKLIAGAVVMLVLAFGMYNLLRLGPEFQMIRLRNRDYVFSFQEVLTHPTDPLRPHLNDLADWLPNLLTVPVFLAWWAGWVSWVKEKRWGLLVYTLALSLGPIMVQAAMAKVFTPRYLLFAIWPLLLPVAATLSKLAVGKRFWLVVIGISILPFAYNYRLVTQPDRAPLPRKMRSGYLEEWTAGQGIEEAAGYFRNRLGQIQGNILVGTEGYFGTLPDGLLLSFDREPRVRIIGVGQPVREVPADLINAMVDNEVYLVVNESRFLVSGTWEEVDSQRAFVTAKYRLESIGQYPKAAGPSGQDSLLVFRLENR